MNQIIELLTEVEATNLAELETTIESGMQSFLQVGEALWKIREGKLYRQSHKTFEAYCRERWQMTDNYARRLINAGDVLKTVPIGTVVTNESQARELAKIEPERRAEVLTKASETGPVTAKSIREAAKEDEPEPDEDEPVELDREPISRPNAAPSTVLPGQKPRTTNEPPESFNLSRLKSIWNQSSKRDRQLFREYITST